MTTANSKQAIATKMKNSFEQCYGFTDVEQISLESKKSLITFYM